MSLVAVYLASPRESGWLRWTRLDCLCASAYLLNKYAPMPVPVIVFNEDYTDEDKARIVKANPNTAFEHIDFSTHKDEFINVVHSERVGTYGYQMMCRFFSGVVQAHPALQQYTHYMRLDDDSYIVAPITQEVMSRITSSDYSYNSFAEEKYPDLYEFTVNFMKKENLPYFASYNPQSVYTNFHASSLALWRHPVVKRYTDEIESIHGCIKKGWTDSTIAYLIVQLLCPALHLSVNFEKGFFYRHNQHCVHHDMVHTIHCYDGRSHEYPWGPPETL